MSRAKCKYCGKWLDTKESIKVTDDGKNRYYCNAWCCTKHSEELIEKAKINAEYDEIIDITREIFGYEFQSIGLLRKEITAWERVGTRQKIISYLKDNKEWLRDVMHKEFNGDYNRVRYYSAVVSSKLHDWKPRVVEPPKPVQPKAVETTFYEIGDVVRKPTRRALDDLEDEI